MSRAGHPKLFLSLSGDQRLFQQTVERLSDLRAEQSFTICNEKNSFYVADQLRKFDALSDINFDAITRNTR
jgi:mannose-1-phosphate guanylyltransferase/mannose-6-phosphate isomerase